jgi:hypothetical protein
MVNRVKLRWGERLIQGLLRGLDRVLSRFLPTETVTWFGGPVEGTPRDDDGTSGVREPRNPKHEPPSLAAEAREG